MSQMHIPDAAHFSVRFDGEGEIVIRGTVKFVNRHSEYLNDTAADHIKAWRDDQIAGGRAESEVDAEMLGALTLARDQFASGVRPVDVRTGPVAVLAEK